MHEKHPKLTKPGDGKFHWRELGIMGLPCSDIKNLAQGIIGRLPQLNIGYVDADHKPEDGLAPGYEQFDVSRAKVNFIDKIAFWQANYSVPENAFGMRKFFSTMDAVLVNGNHFHAEKQILVLDKRKPLEKKADKISNPVLILISGEGMEIPAAISTKFPHVHSLPHISINDIDALAGWLEREWASPVVKGLVLVGGQSSRMQRDKASIAYHGKPQSEHLQELMTQSEIIPHLSVRHDQSDATSNAIKDTFLGLGPYGAILSAFRTDPTAAWLVVACDLPMVTVDTLARLLKKRDPSKLATAYFNKATGFPDPLITLWEPKAYPIMLQFLAMGFSCPRKVLINSDVNLIYPADDLELMNANTPQEAADAMQRISTKF